VATIFVRRERFKRDPPDLMDANRRAKTVSVARVRV
jgi:hypothetical protein